MSTRTARATPRTSRRRATRMRAVPSADYYNVMPPAGAPRIVISGIGVVSPFGVGRERFWDHVTRGCSGTRAITDFDASQFDCQVAAPIPSVTLDDVPPLSRDDIWDEQYRADPKRYSRTALIAV